MSSKPLSSSHRRAKPSTSSSASRVSTLKLDSAPVIGPPPAKKQKLKPLTSLSKAPVFDLPRSQTTRPLSQGIPTPQSAEKKADNKGKHAAVPDIEKRSEHMWVDLYTPTSEADLAVHKRKVEDVRRWFMDAFEDGPSGKLRKYRRILALTGPAGTAKTVTVRVLAQELGFKILEWRNGSEEKFHRQTESDDTFDHSDRMDQEGLSEKFQTFLTRASNCRPIFAAYANETPASPYAPSSSTSSSPPGSSQTQSSRPSACTPATTSKRQVILLEDLPNILHLPTQQAFHAALQAVVNSSVSVVSPIVIIVSDAGLRGEASQDDAGTGTRWKDKEAVDIRGVLPPGLLVSPYVTQIPFNPIAPTLMRPALQKIIASHFSSSQASGSQSQSGPRGTAPSKEILDIIIESANGDIRSAIMALQFACISDNLDIQTNKGRAKGKGKGKGKKGGSRNDGRALMEVVTRREQSLALFHLIGKLLYNKRKGDPPAPSTSAKDRKRDKELDARLKDPPKLPKYLKEHDRKASRVDIEMLYADSPIDSSLLSLYIHQNYTQYCEQVDECDGIVDWLSWVDSSGGESWYQANPHRFHLISLGTLHSLPTPVPRRNQKPYKPEFFDVLKREKEGEDGIREVQAWLQHDEHSSLGGWSRRDIALELGGVLKARDLAGSKTLIPPSTHRLFSRLQFSNQSTSLAELANEEDVGQDVRSMAENEDAFGTRDDLTLEQNETDRRGWLEEDDIEDA